MSPSEIRNALEEVCERARLAEVEDLKRRIAELEEHKGLLALQVLDVEVCARELPTEMAAQLFSDRSSHVRLRWSVPNGCLMVMSERYERKERGEIGQAVGRCIGGPSWERGP